jgi:hypothetical protein
MSPVRSSGFGQSPSDRAVCPITSRPRQSLQRSAVGLEESPVFEVIDGRRRRSRLEHPREALFGLPQERFGVFSLGHVDHDPGHPQRAAIAVPLDHLAVVQHPDPFSRAVPEAGFLRIVGRITLHARELRDGERVESSG